ncbi:hypothetical protein [Pectobacterium phage PEAT2]|uniref:Uncharacterized protein n=1 Tax=Pectobacterium phage PEAT2 TaxID=2053078 RepID=A0A2H4N7D2_9CAUD|nr:hypothetical protein F8206_gp27 [Pectobacterium phage PEAT2]ATV25098.1 hypothetical protein [Pectobacterium phage PEAT2]
MGGTGWCEMKVCFSSLSHVYKISDAVRRASNPRLLAMINESAMFGDMMSRFAKSFLLSTLTLPPLSKSRIGVDSSSMSLSSSFASISLDRLIIWSTGNSRPFVTARYVLRNRSAVSHHVCAFRLAKKSSLLMRVSPYFFFGSDTLPPALNLKCLCHPAAFRCEPVPAPTPILS